MVKNLVIVESPAKAKTIEKFLGKDYTVRSSFGHIRDLAPDKLSVEVEKNFEPNYQIPEDKKKVVDELKKLAKDAEIIWLATDEDREGEAISWHLKEALKLDLKRVKRIVFHEITKTAIQRAIQNPRTIDDHLVDAQQARRILDRLVGFELSPVLWRKVKPSLSAGRVQSVAVRLIVERERDIIQFEVDDYFKVKAEFTLQDKNGRKSVLEAELPGKLKGEDQARDFLNRCNGATYRISDIEVKPAKRTPAAPFTTSTLQQEASRKLSYSVARTMMLAQRLYEAGHITYMRTDSTTLSEEALGNAEQTIHEMFGADYAKRRQYSTKSKSAQEAHEAIRPTNLGKTKAGANEAEQRLYELIWKRTIASQMADARLEKTTVSIGIEPTQADKSWSDKHHLQAQGEVIKFEGFLKVYLESRDDEDEEPGTPKGLLPPMEKGQELDLKEMQARQRFTRPPARYTEASLVKKLEELGIGRPSTYAPTISTVQKRGYVVKETREGEERKYQLLTLKEGAVKSKEESETYGNEKGKMFPTSIGMVVNDFLTQYFQTIMDYNFTARVEKQFDEIAEGGRKWQDMLGDFYYPFHSRVEETLNDKEMKVKKEHHLGDDPTTGKPIYGKVGRYGPYVQLGHAEDEEKPQFAKLRKGQLLETITLEDALELFKLPRKLGEFEEEEVVADIGRFGPYVRHNSKFYSIPKDMDPYEIKFDEAVELMKKKREADKQKTIKEFEHEGKAIKVLRGRYGPYISIGRSNVSIPKKVDAEALTLEEAIELIQAHKEKPPKKGGKRKTTRKKSAS